ncbi:MAG: hypothetical protein ACJA1L_002217 [Paracoccaceae bacterium]|jgi:hypothetical protein
MIIGSIKMTAAIFPADLRAPLVLSLAGIGSAINRSIAPHLPPLTISDAA